MQSDSGDVRDAESHQAQAASPSLSACAKLDATAAAWQTLHASLSPIIGQRGMVALLRRSLYLTRDTHPWLAPVCDTAVGQDLLTALRSAFLLQTETEVAAAHGALLGNFRDLLSTLIGDSLTEKLLRPLLVNNSSGSAAQDTSQ